MAMKSVEKQRLRREEGDRAIARLAELERAGKINVMPERAKRIEKQMDSIERMMNESKDADELQKLSAAHARLFGAWQVLTGTQNPGVKKSSRTRQPQSSAEPLPDPITTKSEEPNG